MIKRITSLFLVLLIALTTGCGRESVRPPADQTQTTQQDTIQPQTAPNTTTLIGEERAKEIALERAGITEDGVRFDRVELDRDDGVLQYEVEFSKDRVEYDANIKADDGAILSFEIDNRD